MQQFYAQTAQDMPLFYDQGLGPVYFADFAEDIARRAAAAAPLQVLEVAAGTGIVSRRLRDFLRAEAHLVVTDLNSAMLDVARAKFGPEEGVDFQPANALSLPFRDEGFDALICQFGVMFFPDKEKACREAYRVSPPVVTTSSASGTPSATTRPRGCSSTSSPDIAR